MANPTRQLPVPPTPMADPEALRQWIHELNEPLRNWVDSAAVAISTLQSQVTTLQADIVALQARVTALGG